MTTELNRFADACHETTGASFTITKLRSGLWQITFVNRGITFSDEILTAALEKAQNYLLSKRKPVEIKTLYTFYV